MVAPRAPPYPGSMTKPLGIVAALVLLPFAAWSTWLAADTGYFEFLRLAGREPWALQLLIDLVLSCALFTLWLVPDARRRGIAAWPYLLVTLAAGSMGGLAYLVHRAVVAHRAGAGAAPSVGALSQVRQGAR